MFLSFVISWFARLVVNSVANSTMRSVYAMSGSVSAARAVTIVFDVVLLAAFPDFSGKSSIRKKDMASPKEMGT